MKNTIKLLMCAVMALCFASCTPNNETPAQEDFVFALNAKNNTIVVSWLSVPEAVFYELQLDNNEVVRTDKNAHTFEDLVYDTTYSVTLKAIAISGEAVQQGTRNITIGKRVIPAYREWVTEIPTTTISDNGLWAVGAMSMDGVIINLGYDKVTITPNVAFYDVDNNGVAVGSYHGQVQSGVAAMYIDGEIFEVDLSSITASNPMSCLTSITPDGTYAVGWYTCSEDDVYYNIYGMYAPFCYDIVNNEVTVPEPGYRVYNVGANTLHAVAPDRSILGCEQSYVGEGRAIMINTLWSDHFTPYEYFHFTYDETYNPILAMGDTNNRFSPNGRYIYGNSSDYTNGTHDSYPAVYDRETKQLHSYASTGSVSAMSDNGVVYINDSPYGNGITAYVTDLQHSESSDFRTLEEWLLTEHGIDVSLYNSMNNTDDENDLILDGVMVLGVSADGKTIMTTTSSYSGWVNTVIYLDGSKE